METKTAEQILAIDDRLPETVEVPEWGTDVSVYPLTCEQIDELERWWQDNPAGVGYSAKLLGMALVDLKLTPAQAEAMEQKNGAVIRRLTRKANQLSNPDYVDLAKNSEADHAGDSGSE